MKYILLALVLFCSVLGALSASIFDSNQPRWRKALGIKTQDSRFDALDNDHSKRHINSFRSLDSREKTVLRKRMEGKTQKFNDETSNERNIWRSHPQQKDFDGPDTASVAGMDF